MFGMIAVFAGVSIADVVPHFARGKKQEADEQNQKNGFGGYLHESKLRKNRDNGAKHYKHVYDLIYFLLRVINAID